MPGLSSRNGDVQEMVFHTWHKQNAGKNGVILKFSYLSNEVTSKLIYPLGTSGSCL
jgi:hypothetical protein